ncbi:MAG TPA: ABC transporter substrate binding protein [Candidatus Limnocylindrales bacterium]|nr:ABC transporter substrate binding protein [Candidatus Limnocylindrales bacterium]
MSPNKPFYTKTASGRLVWLIYLLCTLAGSAAADRVLGADAARAKRVLIISTGSRFSPGFSLVDQAILGALAKLPSGAIESSGENLDILGFPSERFALIFRDYLSEKYAERPPDLVILVYVGNLGTAGKVLQQLFPRTPVIVAGFTEEDIPRDQFDRFVVGIAQRVNPRATIEIIRRLQPDVRRIVVISGTSEVDRSALNRVKQAADSFGGKIDFEYWDDRSMTELRQAVSTLPAQTAVLFSRMFRDGAGHAVISSQAGQSIAQWANAPVYVMTDTLLGMGALGGSVATIDGFGKRAGELARLILTGTAPATLPFEIRTETVPVFDWRALQRWRINESRLPTNSVIRFRPASIWDQYSQYMVVALVIFLLQAALITGLVLNRLNRRRAEKELRENQELLEMATRAGGLGLWARDVTGNQVWANSVIRAQLGIRPDESIQASDLLARIHPDDRAEVIAEVARAHEGNAYYEGEFRIQLSDGEQRWIFTKGDTVNVPTGHGGRRMGVSLDITERKRMEFALRESEENFRRLVETTAAVIWQADFGSWSFTYVTPQAVRLLGYPLEQWYEKDFWTSHIHPDDREEAIDTCLTKSKIAQDFDFEYRMIRSSGEIVWIHDIVSCQHNGGGPYQLRGLMLDITERKRSELAIRESEERFRTVANSAPVMIWMSGADKLCTFFNKGWIDFTGRTLEQELGNGWTEGICPEDVEHCLAVYRNSFDARREYSMEYRLRRRDGEYCWVLGQGVPRFEADGGFLGYIGTATDLSEIKRGDERFRLAVEASSNATVMVNDQGQIVLVNQQTETLFGYSRKELIGQSVELLVPERFRANHPHERARFVAAPQARTLGLDRDLCARRKDGSEILVEIGLTPIDTPEGLLVLTSIVDISARRQAEDALEKERAFLRQVIDIDPNFIFAKDREGRFTLVNQAIADAYGTTVEGLIGKTDADFNSNRDEVEYFHSKDLEVIDSLQERFIAEEKLTDAGGKVRWLQTVKRPIIEETGMANQVLGASTDITMRKTVEAELRQQRDELAHVSRVSLMGELAASLAHELNQPLTAILSNAQAAQRFITNKDFSLDEVREILNDIVDDNNRASEIIRKIRALVRKEELTLARLDLPAVVGEVVSLVHSDAILRNVKLNYQIGGAVAAVRGDRIQLQQVMLNLFLNAFDAMKECAIDDRQLTIRVDAGVGTVEVSVCDHGSGLTSAALESIFNPFFTTKREGLGMGLSISRAIVERHGGRLWAENNNGRGSTFYVVLPEFVALEQAPELS